MIVTLNCRAAGVLTLLGTLLCCSRGQAPPSVSVTVNEIKAPANSGAKSPHLLSDGNRFVLSWYEPAQAKNYAFRFATGTGDSWSVPLTVLQSEHLQLHSSVLSSVAYFPSGSVVAAWDQIESQSPYSEAIYAVATSNNGTNWTSPHRISRAEPGEHSYLSLARAGPNRAMAVWLSGGIGPGEKTRLIAATLNSDGIVDTPAVLDDDVCTCCPTSLAQTENGFVVAYRDRTADDIRDISTAVYQNGAWLQGHNVHHDGWKLKGCPTNGPSLAALGRQVALVWFTAANQAPKVFLAFSKDEGLTFGPPVQIDEGQAQGYASVVLLADDEALVSWIERAAKGSELKVRRVGLGGHLSPSKLVATGYKLGHPNLRRVADQTMICWTESSDDSSPTSVHTALLSVVVAGP